MENDADTNLWARYSRSLVKSIPRKNTRLTGVAEVFPSVVEEDQCLDIGTASGGFALFFATTGKWIFVEPNAEHIRAAKKILRGSFVQTDGESFLLEGAQKFNLITALAILYFIPDFQRFFGLVRARLLAGGHFIVSGDDVAASGFFGPLRRALGIEAFTGGCHAIGFAEVQRCLEAAGLRIRNVSRSTGPATLAFQTVLDGLLVAFSRLNSKSKKDRLTLPVAGEVKKLSIKRLTHFPIRLLTEFLKLVDALFWFLPRYDYVICAEVTGLQSAGSDRRT